MINNDEFGNMDKNSSQKVPKLDWQWMISKFDKLLKNMWWVLENPDTWLEQEMLCYIEGGPLYIATFER